MTENSNSGNSSRTVFFSYSRADQEHALPIIKAIEHNGYGVWWDGLLEVGTTFLDSTEQALESAEAVVVLWSKTSVNSHWVRDEATSGRVRDRLVPLSLDGTDAPLGFRQVQIINMENWDGATDAPQMLEIQKVLAQYHDAPSLEVMAAPTTISLKTPKISDKITRRNMMISSAGAAAVASLGFYALPRLKKQPGRSENSLAVLPFENITNDSAYDYIANGLSTEIRSSLARNPALKIAARSSCQSLVEQAKGAKEIGEKLGVAYILEGSVNIIQDMAKVSVDFINSQTGFSENVQSFEHPADKILEIHDEITQSVYETLSLKFDDPNNDIQPTQSAAAFNEYLKAKEIIQTSTLSALEVDRAIGFYDAALAADPNFGLAYEGKAQALLWKTMTGSDVNKVRLNRGRAIEAARRATEVSPNRSSGYSTLGYILFLAKLDISGAAAPFEKAAQLGVGDAPTLARHAVFLAAIGSGEKARTVIEQATNLDPLNPTIFEVAGFVHYAARRYDEAISAFEKVLSLNPGRFNAHARIGSSKILQGDVAAGMAACETENNLMEKLPCQAIGYYRSGDKESAERAFDRLRTEFGDAGAYQQAQIYAATDRPDKAMETLTKAYDLGDSGLTLLNVDPFMQPLRDKQEFRELLAKLGYPS